MKDINNLWKNYSLSLVLFLVFITTWVLHGLYEWKRYEAEATQHNQEISMMEYTNEFLAATFENWQSEFLQLFSMVVLTAIFVHKGSSESRDSQDKMQASLDRIEKQLKTLIK